MYTFTSVCRLVYEKLDVVQQYIYIASPLLTPFAMHTHSPSHSTSYKKQKQVREKKKIQKKKNVERKKK